MRIGLCLLAALLSAPLAGCGSSPPAQPPKNNGAEAEAPAKATPTPKVVAIDSLPIGQAMPTLDDGRLEIAKPEGWNVPSRDSKYVVRFVAGDERYPRIHVTVEDDWSETGDLTDDNVAEFAEKLSKRLQSPDHKVQLIEPVIPMVIGERPVARYVRRTRFKGTVRSVTVERQVLATVIGGRLYEIDLQTPPGTLLEHRDAGYAVAASMKSAAED